MNFKRTGRFLVCLVLICALLINVSPIKAKAELVSGGLIAAGATGAVVSVPVAIAIGATLICLGVMADAVSQNPFALQQVASQVEQHLTAAGTFVKDGMVEMYRFVTETGEAVYYAAADFMETCRSYLFDSQVVVSKGLTLDSGYTISSPDWAIAQASSAPYSVFVTYRSYAGSGPYWYVCYSYEAPVFAKSLNGESGIWIGSADGSATIFGVSCFSSSFQRFTGSCYSDASDRFVSYQEFGTSVKPEYISDYAVSLGLLLSVPIDGTSARAWSEAYANRGLYIASGGSQNPDDGAEGNNGWKFLLPLALLAGADLWAMTQADQWTGSTPPEFGDYSTQEELTVTPAPEFDGYPAIEIAPVPNTNPDPGTGTDPGTGSDPDTGGESAELNWWERFTKWFLDLRTSINELPNKFDEHFENLNNNIQEVPNKFETWIRGVQTSVDALADKIVGTAEQLNLAIQGIPDKIQLGFVDLKASVDSILTAIQNIPNAILNGLQHLFVPDPDYFAGKVESLKAKFPIVSNVQDLGNNMKTFFLSLGTKAPIIYIDLGASQWHPIGGRVKFIDLTWYSQYKPTMDTILGGFLWLWTGWRLLHAAPGIISGAAGTWGQPTSINDLTFMSYQPRLPSGNKRKKED